MDELLIPKDVRLSKNQSQTVLTDNKLFQELKQPQSFRRHFLMNRAEQEGFSYHFMPLIWKIPFLKKLEEIDAASFALITGSEYRISRGSGQLLTFVSLFKSMICTGILYTPRGFMLGGWLFSSLCFLFVGTIYYISVIWLCQAKERYGGSFNDLGNLAMGKAGYYLIEICIYLTQLGYFLSACVFFVCNLQNVFSYFGLDVSLWICGVIQVCLLTPLVMPKKLSDLSIVYLVGDLIILVTVVYISAESVSIIQDRGMGTEINAFESNTFLMVIGTSFFTFEGTAMVVPIREAMKEPHKFWYLVLLLVVVICIIEIAFGVLTNFAYGSDTAQVITLNLELNTGTIVLMIVFLFSVIFGQPMILFASLATMDHYIGNRNVLSKIGRFATVLLVTVLAVSLYDKADRFVSLMGGVLCGPIAFIFPAIINLKTKTELRGLELVLTYAILAIGSLATVVCLYVNIKNW